MGKSKNRFHAAKQDKSRRTRTSTTACQAPPTRFKKSSNKKRRVKEVAASPTDECQGTGYGLHADKGPKTRKRKSNSRKGKNILAGSNHRRLAASSLKRQGKGASNASHKTKSRKNKQKEAGRKPEMTAEESLTDYGGDRRTLVAYTDGSYLKSAAGIGVWWGLDDERNLSERCPGRQTSTGAEIFAIVRLLEEAPMLGKKGRLVIRTDSRCAIQCAMSWGPMWQTKGWTTASGDEVKDADMIQYLLALLSLRTARGEVVVFEHVRGHSKNVGNDGADALAKRGTKEPTMPERDWLTRRRLVEAIRAKVGSHRTA